MAARSENVSILKKNYKKKIILLDRFVDSTIAYQHFGMGLSLKLINIINNDLLKSIKIDLTFLNLVSKSNLIKRLKDRKKLNRYDKFNFNFYDKVQKGFVKIAKKKPSKYYIVNSNLDINFNKELIIKKIQKIIK